MKHLGHERAAGSTQFGVRALYEFGPVVLGGYYQRHDDVSLGVRNVFRLDDRQIGSMMIPRAEIVWIDAQAPMDEVVNAMVEHGHTRYPVCRGGLDDVQGIIDRVVSVTLANPPTRAQGVFVWLRDGTVAGSKEAQFATTGLTLSGSLLGSDKAMTIP